MRALLACKVRLVRQSLIEAELSQVALLLDRLLPRPHAVRQYTNAGHALAREFLIVVPWFVLLWLLHWLPSSSHNLRKVNSSTRLLETAVQMGGSCLGIQTLEAEFRGLGTCLLASCPVNGGIGECSAEEERVVGVRVGLDQLVVKYF